MVTIWVTHNSLDLELKMEMEKIGDEEDEDPNEEQFWLCAFVFGLLNVVGLILKELHLQSFIWILTSIISIKNV